MHLFVHDGKFLNSIPCLIKLSRGENKRKEQKKIPTTKTKHVYEICRRPNRVEGKRKRQGKRAEERGGVVVTT